MSILSETHMCLLRDYRTAWQIKKQIESLNVEIAKILDQFWQEKALKLLGNDYLLGDTAKDNPKTLAEDYLLMTSKKTWIHSSNEKNTSLLVQMYFSLSEQHENNRAEEDWIEFFLGLIPDNRMGINYHFDECVNLIAEKIGRKGKFAKDELLGKMGDLKNLFELHGYTLVRSSGFCYDKPIVLPDLLIGLENEDLDLAFAPILTELENFKIFSPHIDRLIQELT